jgi:5-(carboxyamino)imidazole ribonucleotide mutase
MSAASNQPTRPMIALLAQSDDGLELLRHAEQMLDRFGVAWAASLVHDADRTIPELDGSGIEIFIVANASRTPLSARVAALTTRPVLAVPVPAAGLSPLEALQATTAPDQPPVGSLAIGKAGAINAALFAVAILANAHPDLRQRLHAFRDEQTRNVLQDRLD